MRSFISKNAAPDSYGSTVDVVEYFDCIDGGTTVVPTPDESSTSATRLLDGTTETEMLSF